MGMKTVFFFSISLFLAVLSSFLTNHSILLPFVLKLINGDGLHANLEMSQNLMRVNYDISTRFSREMPSISHMQ